MSNAIKYGAGKPIDVRVEGAADTVCLTVVDQGIGIEPLAIANIFEPYTRSAHVKGLPGLGLGLWITRQIVSRLGGTIDIRSELGKGTKLMLEIPRVVRDGADSARRAGRP